MNTRAKGRRSEYKAKKILEDVGYSVTLTQSPSKWSLEQDMFGLWDLIAVNAVSVRFVQIKTNGYASKEWKEQAGLWQCPPNCTKEVWRFLDRVKEPIITIL
jgi:hypothetical protein